MLVKSEGSGICAGDLKNYQGASMYWGGDGMVGICRPPFIPGHEFVGRIVKTGKNVTGFQPGDRVVAEQIGPLRALPLLPDGKVLDVQKPGRLRLL